MWQDKLKEIIYILENSNVNEIEIKSWGHQYRVVKNPSATVEGTHKANRPVILENENLADEVKLNNDKTFFKRNLGVSLLSGVKSPTNLPFL